MIHHSPALSHFVINAIILISPILLTLGLRIRRLMLR